METKLESFFDALDFLNYRIGVLLEFRAHLDQSTVNKVLAIQAAALALQRQIQADIDQINQPVVEKKILSH